ncbi:methionyl-tRNA formyltransferase [Lactobacillus sp. DCY120]|uniref:Methionyl-tRNA formyltransferase n=1 Tax=Bombilactobacillus apium TaxID=2675299 RepID=A0A850R216_9LACO|nr:methionyl-tRNA formyltransferase [Bombilactobacillus apium]NVY96963.1 methionyl-tRNA formyltransferase [Bombilactobacillus apium]
MTKVIFMGTPPFAVNILAGLLAQNYEIMAVVTQPDKAVGRKHKLQASPVKVYAEEHGLKVYQPAKLSGSPELQGLIKLQPDLIITAAFGQFLPTSLLKAARLAALNVHGSLLPRNRGGAPIQRAIMNGDQETGVTIMYMAAQMDAGDIISQVATPISATDTAGDLFARLSDLGRDLLLETLPQVLAGTNSRQEQVADLVTITPNLSPEEEVIQVQNSALQINRQVRGLNPEPGAYFSLLGSRVKVFATKVGDQTTTKEPGQVVVRTKNELAIAVGQQTVLYLEQLQPAGKKIMPVQAFLNGQGREIQVGDQIIDQ